MERSGRLRLTWYEKEAMFKRDFTAPGSEQILREQVSQLATYTALARLDALGTEDYVRYLQIQEDIQVLTARLIYLEQQEELEALTPLNP